ncbi:sensor histidine kinase [Streptosporangium minutum]|uniref:Histidine kinase n=1 Tax=Streptosporangium minutum TaxID=569862 RepID=A0A243RJA9_9ACTN|nr:histidine kinase [Streptosporangium minutum]OUC94213.1 histidine kinase [Streptosporangium minutum]
MRDGSSERGTGLSGFRRYTWWSLAGSITVSLVLLVRPWAMDEGAAPWVRGATGLALAVLVVAVVVLLGRRLPRLPGDAQDRTGASGARERAGGPPVGWLAAGGLAAAVLGAVPLALRDDGLWATAPAVMVSITATFLRPAHRRTLIAGAVVAAAALGGSVALASGDTEWLLAGAFPAGMVASVAWMALGMLWAWDVADRLDLARYLAAELAVKNERLRFAADLHDIQGHHLQVIALKSELAERLAEAAPGRAAAEMREVRRLAADALRDTRAVVQGYRRTTLEDEIANAAKVLAAADIDTAVDHGRATGAGTLPEPARHILGLVMREATTNVLRHSRARQAYIAYDVEDGRARLRIGNDGVEDGRARLETDDGSVLAGPARPGADDGTAMAGPARPGAGDGGVMGGRVRLGAGGDGDAERPRAGAGPGTGLRSLAERLERVAGTLDWRCDGDRFEVVASLPADARAYPAEAGAR